MNNDENSTELGRHSMRHIISQSKLFTFRSIINPIYKTMIDVLMINSVDDNGIATATKPVHIHIPIQYPFQSITLPA